MNSTRYLRLLAMLLAGTLLLNGCGDDAEDPVDAPSESGDTTPDPGDTSGADPGDPATTTPIDDGTAEPPVDDPQASQGAGVILADLCAGGQPLDGAISLDDLVSFGILTSTNATVEGSAAYSASAYETFGFLCNISEDVGDGENFLTIGIQSGSDVWDLAVDQGDAPVEQMGDWEVMIGSNWLSPLTMRITDADGNQDSLFATWTPSDGSIPDADTLARLMRPLAEAIATRSTVDIPRS